MPAFMRLPLCGNGFVRAFFVLFAIILNVLLIQNVSAQTIVGATSGKVGVSPSGAASYSIPIAVPIGTTGVQPKIALQYNSQGGNGLLGVGWSVLGQSTITRCATDLYFDDPAKGGVGIDPVDYDDNDKFCLNSERMMALSGTYGADGTEYRTAFESFSKIISHGDTGGSPTSFTVYRKSGEIFTYGTSTDSRVVGQNQTKARTWALKRITDVKGNYVEFSYHNDKASGEFYITRIDYTGNDTLGLTPYNYIDFIYEDRPDPIKAHMSGDTVQITKRLKNVKIYAGSNLFHDYRLAYGAGATGRSRLVSVTECATDTKCFQPTTFAWSSDGGTGFDKRSSASGMKISAWHKVFATGDFNGDGLTDFYTADPRGDSGGGAENSTQYVHLANADGTFLKKQVPSGDRLVYSRSVFTTGDFNGDGLTDLYTADPRSEGGGGAEENAQYIHLSKGDGTFTRMLVAGSDRIVFARSVFVTGDFNGDGLADFLTADPRGNSGGGVEDNNQYVHLSRGDGTFERKTLSTSERIVSKRTVFVSGDFNGDGLTDFYTADPRSEGGGGAENNAQYIHLSKGDGTFIRTEVLEANRIIYRNGVFVTGDFNGDGLTDFMTADPRYFNGGVTNAIQNVHISNGDGSFTKRPVAEDQRIPNTWHVFASGDFNGDGLTDFFTAKPKNEQSYIEENTQEQFIHYSRGNGSFDKVLVSSNQKMSSWHKVFAVGDYNGDGLTDLLTADPKDNSNYTSSESGNLLFSAHATPDQLTHITNGHGITTEFVYKPLTDSTVYTKGTGAVYPIQDQTYAAYVVAELKADNGKGGQNTQRYQYSGMRSQLTGFGSLGFETMTVTDVPTGIKTVSTYSQDWTKHFQGLLTNEKTVTPDGTILTEKTVNWKVRGLSDPNQVFVSCFRYVDSTVTEKRDLNGAFISRVVEQSTYDEYGYPSRMTVTTMNEDGSEAYSKITTNTYTHNPTTWRLGRLTDANVVHKKGTVEPVIGSVEQTTQTSSTQLVTETITIEEDFEGTVSGWNDEYGIAPNPVGSVTNDLITGTKILGKISGSSSDQAQQLGKTFSVNEEVSHVNIEFDMYGIGGSAIVNKFYVFVNGQVVAQETLAAGFNGTATTDYSVVTWTGQDYFGSFENPKPAFKRRFTVSVPVTSTGTGNLKIGFGTYATNWEGNRDSSYKWGVDNLKLSIDYQTNKTIITYNTETIQTTSWTGPITSDGTDYTRTSSFDYDTDGLLKPEVVEPGSDLSYTKTNNYNDYGATTSITETWASPENDGIVENTRTTSYTYDDKIRYKLTETNPLGHQQTNTYHPVLGLLTSTTGPNGLTTTFEYDEFGRKTKETRADGTWTETHLEMCGGSISCPADAKFRTRTVSSGGAESMVYMDQLNRKIRTRTLADGKWIVADTVYDVQGRVEKKSEPYFEGQTTIYWTTIEYDLLGRPVSTVMADNSTQSVTYNGLTQTSTNELNQTKTVIKNIMGQTVEVIDNHNQPITYTYDALGQMKTITGNGKTQTFAYDIRGNKILDSDPDKGTWTYRYNALGQIVEQTDAKGQITRMTYDVLGRMLTRIDDATGTYPEDRTATWTYDTATNGIGKLHTATSNGYVVTNSYDALGRPSSSTETIDDEAMTTTTTYDSQSRPDTMTYPSGLTIKNIYDGQGALLAVESGDSSTRYWERLEVDERGNITKAKLGNGVETTRSYQAENGRLTGINTYKGVTNIQQLSYNFDALGNLTKREDLRLNQTETFIYDTLNRVTDVNTTVGGTTTTTTMSYGPTGNILSKSDVGTYTYGEVHGSCASGFAGPHALTTVSGTKNATYCYDANGNMTTGDGRTITYTAFDKPTRITKGATTVDFFYGPDRKRFKRIDNTVSGGTVTTVYAAGKAYEWIREASGTKLKHYIGDFAVITKTVPGDGETVNYLHRDHLGSVDTITDNTGAVIQRMSFDAWGKRREINWQAMADPAITAFNSDTTTRGFTGHEMIDSVGLIHMNGRVYDPTLGRFLSADPNVQALDNLQNFNRYSYVLNNPLSYTDPTGFFFSKLFKAIGKAFGKIFKAIGNLLKKALRNPIVRAILQIAVCTIGPYACAAAAGVAAAADGGSMADVLKAVAFSFIGSEVWTAVGAALDGVSQIGQMLVHGVVNGAMTAAQGGNFLVGFATGAIGKLGGIVSQKAFGAFGTGGPGAVIGRTIIAAISGCAGAVISGGKCANGAISAAMAHLFNAEKWMHRSIMAVRKAWTKRLLTYLASPEMNMHIAGIHVDLMHYALDDRAQRHRTVAIGALLVPEIRPDGSIITHYVSSTQKLTGNQLEIYNAFKINQWGAVDLIERSRKSPIKYHAEELLKNTKRAFAYIVVGGRNACGARGRNCASMLRGMGMVRYSRHKRNGR